MQAVLKFQGRIRRHIRRNREALKLHYGHDRKKQFRAANLLTTIWWVNSVILTLLAVFILLPNGLLDIRGKSLFSIVLLIIGVMFAGCYQLILKNKFMAARRIIVGGVFVATGFATLMTGGFPTSVSTASMLIPIVLSYCTYGGRISHISMAATVAFLFSQFAVSQFFGVKFPDLASFANPQLNYVLVLAATFAIVIMALINLDISTRTYIERADRAAESKSNFLANMSHELRTPLNGVIGLTDVMLKTELDTNQKVYMDAIDVSGRSLFSIITDILDFSKIESGHVEMKHEEFNLRETLDRLFTKTEKAAKDSPVKLHLFYPKDCPERLIGDRGKLEQILVHLVGNAMKFTSEGYVSVKVSVIPHPKMARLRIDVQDTGIGISTKHREQIFGQFTQGESSTTKRFGGTGLGLAISERLVNLMNGEIGVTSKPGEGSTFWFEIDTEIEGQNIEVQKDVQPKTQEVPSVAVAPQGKTFLITPRPDICQDLFAQLSQEKNRVFTGPPGQETLAFLSSLGFQKDWNSTVFIDDVSEMEAANAFVASLRASSKFESLQVVRVSSLDRTQTNMAGSDKTEVAGTAQRRYG